MIYWQLISVGITSFLMFQVLTRLSLLQREDIDLVNVSGQLHMGSILTSLSIVNLVASFII